MGQDSRGAACESEDEADVDYSAVICVFVKRKSQNRIGDIESQDGNQEVYRVEDQVVRCVFPCSQHGRIERHKEKNEYFRAKAPQGQNTGILQQITGFRQNDLLAQALRSQVCRLGTRRIGRLFVVMIREILTCEQ